MRNTLGLTGSEDRFGILSDKHEVASFVKDKLGDINLVDGKRIRLIIFGTEKKNLHWKYILDGYQASCFLL